MNLSMETNSKVFAMAMICVLAMAAALSASVVAEHRDLMADDKGDGIPNESKRVAPYPATLSPPVRNHAINQDHSPPESPSAYSTIPKSLSLADNSDKPVPSPGPEDLSPGAAKKVENKTSQSPPKEGDNKPPEAPKEEGNKPVQSLEKGDHKVLQAPDLVNKAPEALKTDNVQEQSGGTSNFGNPDASSSKNESCEAANASNLTCRTGTLVACLLHSGTESRDSFLIIQNTGEDDLNVNITSPDKIKVDSKPLNVPKQSNKKVNLMADSSMDLKIILNAGKGDCVLQTETTPTSEWLYLQQLPAYAAQVRPMHGAYFLFATLIIVGGTWAVCKLGKKEKRVDGGVPYQQLEMATHTRSSSAPAHVVAADTWDQSWDDDWDDEEAVVRASAKQPTENGSSNSPASKPANPNQNGWEIDWDD